MLIGVNNENVAHVSTCRDIERYKGTHVTSSSDLLTVVLSTDDDYRYSKGFYANFTKGNIFKKHYYSKILSVSPFKYNTSTIPFKFTDISFI